MKKQLNQWAALIDRLPSWKLCIYLAYVCMIIYLLTGSGVIGGDSPGIAYLPASILRHGTLRLDPYINGDYLFDLSNEPHYVVESNGHYYSKFSPLPSILALPIYGLYFLFVGYPDEKTGNMVIDYIKLSSITSTIIGTSVVLLIFLILRKVMKQQQALLLALVYAFSVHTWTTATKTMATQSTGELFLALGILFLVQMLKMESNLPRKYLFLSGFCLSLSLVTRLQLILVFMILGVYILYRYRQTPVMGFSYFIGIVPPIMLYILYNIWAFGSPFSTGYGNEAMDGWTTPIWVGLPGILFSPSHGLLAYSPAFLFAIIGGIAVWKAHPRAQQPENGLSDLYLFGRYLSLCALVQLLLMSHWWAWYGGVAYNQRMLQEIHPILILLAAIGLSFYKEKVWIQRIFGLAVGWGIFMHLARIAFYTQHLEWVEAYHPTLIWSLRYSEIPMYIQWHGIWGFLGGISRVLIKVGSIGILITLILFRLLKTNWTLLSKSK
ncbi:MAG: glycosyltransferase family 39 protein [Bacteroidales bacterium]|nr:glycosyltransferase family 39 protein [Bacteroidales bacterium]